VKLNIPKRNTILVTTLGVIVGLLTATIYYSYANGSNDTFTISQGPYPGAPSFTIWKEDSTYYAKNSYGRIAYYGSNLSIIVQNANDALTNGGRIYLKDVEKPSVTISSDVTVIEEYEGIIRYYDSNGQWTNRRDIVQYIENYTWTDLDAEQGVALDGTYIYIANDDYLQKWTKTGTKLYEEDIFNGWGNLTHVGDITYWNGSVYCPCTDWGGGSRTLGYIMVYSSADLSFVASYDIGIGTIPNSTDLSGIAYIYDPNEDTNDFWILGGDALRIYKYNEAFSYQTRYYDLPYSGWDWYDGICFNRENGRLYGNTGSLLIEFSAIPPTNMEDAHDILAIRTQVIIRPPKMYYEGIAIDPDEKHMYMAQKHSAGDDPLGLFNYFP